MWGGWELALVSNNPSPPLNDNHKICQQRWPWMNGRPSQVHLHQQRMATGVKISRWDCSKTMGINAWMILQTFKFSETACKKNELYTSMHRPMEKKNNNNTKKKKKHPQKQTMTLWWIAVSIHLFPLIPLILNMWSVHEWHKMLTRLQIHHWSSNFSLTNISKTDYFRIQPVLTKV